MLYRSKDKVTILPSGFLVYERCGRYLLQGSSRAVYGHKICVCASGCCQVGHMAHNTHGGKNTSIW